MKILQKSAKKSTPTCSKDSETLSGRAFLNTRFAASTWQADMAQKGIEARVRAERIKPWPQQHARIKSLFVAFFEPGHRLILIAQSRIYHGNFRAMRITRAGALLQIGKQFLCFGPLADCGVGARKICHACRAA